MLRQLLREPLPLPVSLPVFTLCPHDVLLELPAPSDLAALCPHDALLELHVPLPSPLSARFPGGPLKACCSKPRTEPRGTFGPPLVPAAEVIDAGFNIAAGGGSNGGLGMGLGLGFGVSCSPAVGFAMPGLGSGLGSIVCFGRTCRPMSDFGRKAALPEGPAHPPPP